MFRRPMIELKLPLQKLNDVIVIIIIVIIIIVIIIIVIIIIVIIIPEVSLRFPGHQISWVIDSVRSFSPWAS